MLTAAEARIAKSLYRRWFSKNPGAKNPSDVNTKDKYKFWFSLGWESLELCQRARRITLLTTSGPTLGVSGSGGRKDHRSYCNAKDTWLYTCVHCWTTVHIRSTD